MSAVPPWLIFSPRDPRMACPSAGRDQTPTAGKRERSRDLGRRPITTEAIGSAATRPSLRGALATKQSRGHNMRGASNPDGRTAAPGLLRFARNDGQGIDSLVSACRLSSNDDAGGAERVDVGKGRTTQSAGPQRSGSCAQLRGAICRNGTYGL